MAYKKPQVIKYFPFAPGIAWRFNKWKYINPTIAVQSYFSAIENKKDIVIVGFGGLIESYYSLSILETINYYFPGKKVSWLGYSKFNHLIKANGIAQVSDLSITKDILNQFPAPIFFDKENRIYFNYLNNYLTQTSWDFKHSYQDDRPIIEQLIEKNTLEWHNRYLPKIRNNDPSEELKQNIKYYKFNIALPFVLIIPDKTDMSNHNVSCLNWGVKEIRALAIMLKSLGIKTIILSNMGYLYSYIDAIMFKFSIENYLYFSQAAKLILAKDIDYLLCGNANVASLPFKHEFSLEENFKVINRESKIYQTKKLTPYYIFEKIKKDL